MNGASYELGVLILLLVGGIVAVKSVSLMLDYRAFRKARQRREAVEREYAIMRAATAQKEIR